MRPDSVDKQGDVCPRAADFCTVLTGDTVMDLFFEISNLALEP